MSKSTPPSTSRSKYVSLIAAALLAWFAIALAVLPSRSAEAVSSGEAREVNYKAGNSGTILTNNFIKPLSFVNPMMGF
jgi:hypothetical protein